MAQQTRKAKKEDNPSSDRLVGWLVSYEMDERRRQDHAPGVFRRRFLLGPKGESVGLALIPSAVTLIS